MSPYQDSGLQRLRLRPSPTFKGWNSDVQDNSISEGGIQMSRILISRKFPESSSQGILVGIMLVGRLAVLLRG